MGKVAKNEDREIWRQKDGDFYSPSIHITKDGQVGINVGGLVYVAPVEDWHKSLVQTKDRVMKKEDYKCTKCGLEIIIMKVKSHKLPKAECQDCGTMTMRPISPLRTKYE